MHTAYMILPDTPLTVSRNGAEFKPLTVRGLLRFDAPDETTLKTITFTRGNVRYRVLRSKVVVSRRNGDNCEHEFGA